MPSQRTAIDPPRLERFFDGHRVGGDFYDPRDPENALVTTARYRFLQAIAADPTARRLVLDSLEALLHEPSPNPLLAGGELAAELKHLRSLTPAVGDWATALNLCRDGRGEWILSEARDTLECWTLYGGMRRSRTWSCARYYCFGEEGPSRGARRLPEFDPNVETLDAYKARYDAAAARLERFPEQHGPEHYRWLVARQIERKPIPDIDRSPEVTQDAVRQAVNRLRPIIDLPKAAPGRPRKK